MSNLKQLNCRRDEINSLNQRQQLFPNLQRLQVFDNDSTTAFPLCVLQGLDSVQELALIGTSFVEIFSYEDLEKYKEAFAQIRELSLYELDKLKEIWKQDASILDPVLQNNIGVLYVKSCSRLVTLMPHSSSFKNLTKLIVMDCDGLRNLFEPATAKSLEQLEYLTIASCKMMEEVICSNEEAVQEHEIIFDNLHSLVLYDLLNLMRFCPKDCTITFPSLSGFGMTKCPNMKFFSQGVLNTPRLHTIRNGSDLLKSDRIDLNATIHEMNRKQVLIICFLILCSFPFFFLTLAIVS